MKKILNEAKSLPGTIQSFKNVQLQRRAEIDKLRADEIERQERELARKQRTQSSAISQGIGKAAPVTATSSAAPEDPERRKFLNALLGLGAVTATGYGAAELGKKAYKTFANDDPEEVQGNNLDKVSDSQQLERQKKAYRDAVNATRRNGEYNTPRLTDPLGTKTSKTNKKNYG
jgi:hypothetical protein